MKLIKQVEVDAKTAIRMLTMGYTVLLIHADSKNNVVDQISFKFGKDVCIGDLKKESITLYDIMYGTWKVEVKDPN